MQLTEQSFKKVIEKNNPVVVMFWGSWCPVCKQYIEVLKKYEGGITVYTLNIDLNPVVATQYKIRGTPTFIVFKNNKEQSRHVGALTFRQFQHFTEGVVL